jgi:hypothetical protein
MQQHTLPVFTKADFKHRNRTAAELMVEFVHDVLTGKLEEKTPEEKRVDEYRERCRQGDPFPLIAMQWPSLLITDPDEAKWFEGEIGNPDNPCLRLDDWQRNDVILPFFDSSVFCVAIKGNTKAGKGASVSICTNLWFDVFESKIILSSATYSHAADVIFGEIVKWRSEMQFPLPASVLVTGISAGPQHYVTISNPRTGEGFSGQHGDHTLFVLDESSGVPDSHYDNATKQARKIVALSNPRTLFGWFRDLYKSCTDQNKTETVPGPFGRVHCVTVGGSDCLNVRAKRLERPFAPFGGIEIDGHRFEQNDPIPPNLYERVKPLIPSQCDYARYVGILQHPDKRHVDVFGHGKFPEEDPEKQVILASYFDRHHAAYDPANPPPVEAFGFDIARSMDGDSTSLAAGGILGLRKLHLWKYADTTHHVGEAIRIAASYGIDLTLGRHPVCVDMDGLGAGVADQLRQKGVWVIEFRGNMTSQVDPRIYGNLRAEGYGTLGRRLDPNDQWGGEPWAMPPDSQLVEELTAPEKIYGSDSFRFHLTPKVRPSGSTFSGQSVKEKLGRSPDRADSVVYLWHAVRELHLLNQYFMAVTGDLTVYPGPATVSRSSHQEQQAEESGDLLGWLEARYGGNRQAWSEDDDEESDGDPWSKV